MSTIDPRVARAQKAERGRRSGRSAAAAVVVGLLHLGLWTVAGYGFGELYDVPRLMSINQVGEGWDSRFDGIPVLFIVGIFAGSVLGFVFMGLAGRLLGLAGSVLAPLVTGSFGIALGLLLFQPQWTAPQSYGELSGFLPGDPATPWDTGAWIAYHLPVWLPLLFAALGALLLAVLLLAVSAARRKAKRMAEVIDTGRRVKGAVSEVRPTGTEINGMPYLEFTVAFRDHLGTERWVTKKFAFPPGQLPRAGDPALVWFVPAEVDDQKSIVVGLGPEAAEAV
ncbi:MAG: hypothetical protein Q7T71_05575 [Herbiconiux sp.]|nr:hypothetical protein [Herbiconiux sp.]